MTHYKLPKQPIDDIRTNLWSIAFLSSVGGGKSKAGAIGIFDLFNRQTNRAHRFTITAGGKSSGLPVEVSFRDSGYMKFKTEIIANFDDFHHKRAKLELKDRIGKSWRSVTVFQRDAIKKLMNVEVNNWNLTGWHAFEGHGITEIYYSDGKPVGNPEYELRIEPKDLEEIYPDHKIEKRDFGYVIKIPGDALFDFNRDVLHYEAEQRVSDAIKYINSLDKDFTIIEIEGHTDNKEKVPGYNLKLSKRRAEVVMDYMTRNKWSFDRDMTFGQTRGLGATVEKAPNQKPDGSDNPAGRELNRRVEIIIKRR